MSRANQEKARQNQNEPEACECQCEPDGQAAYYKELAMRMQADFENYKKRYEKERAEWNAFAEAEFIAGMLPVLDSFEAATKNNPDEGLKGIYRQLLSALEAHGLRRIESVGKQFDPYKHEVLMIEKSEQDNIVLEELQAGYMVKGAVIRHSKVKVGKSDGD